jgi:hypothetical protein
MFNAFGRSCVRLDSIRKAHWKTRMQNEGSDTKRLRDQIETWLNRAAMAYQMNHDELSKQALHYRWEYQKQLALLEGTEPPEAPQEPEDFFRGWDRGGPRKRDPDQPAPVPRRPLPNAGAGEIALPIPEQSSDDERA